MVAALSVTARSPPDGLADGVAYMKVSWTSLMKSSPRSSSSSSSSLLPPPPPASSPSSSSPRSSSTASCSKPASCSSRGGVTRESRSRLARSVAAAGAEQQRRSRAVATPRPRNATDLAHRAAASSSRGPPRPTQRCMPPCRLLLRPPTLHAGRHTSAATSRSATHAVRRNQTAAEGSNSSSRRPRH
eukprot:scaffold1300_cov317-Prasinococcus_capsulatus_cf.AAC.21